jgi:hypothetical protein
MGLNKAKIPWPNGWTMELYLDFVDLQGDDLVNMVEESRISGWIPRALNATIYL